MAVKIMYDKHLTVFILLKTVGVKWNSRSYEYIF